MAKIFAIRGTPNQENWPGVEQLEDYVEFKQMEPANLAKTLPMLSAHGVNLLEKMLQLNPNKRPSAEEALNHAYFSEEPLACEPKDLPI